MKKDNNLPIYEPQREAAVIARVKELNTKLGGPLDEQAIGRLYERIIDEARRIQRIEAKLDPEPQEPDDFVEAGMQARSARLQAARTNWH